MPEIGDIGLCKISGTVGFLVKIGIWLNGDGLHRFQHAFVVVNEGLGVEAQPGGAALVGLSEHPDAVYVSPGGLSAETRARIAELAVSSLGTPYSFLDYVALVTVRLRLWPLNRWLRRRVADSKHLICSQLVDLVYEQAGVNLFVDGRSAGDVTPGDLARRFGLA